MQDDSEQDLALFLQAVRQGLLTGAQLQDCLQEWSERYGGTPEGPSPFQLQTVAVQKGYVTFDRLRALSAPSPSDAAVTERRIEFVMPCRDCDAERTVSLEAAIRNPRCAGCSGTLRF